MYSGQVLQQGWGLDTLPACCGDLLGLGGPVTQTKLNFSVLGGFILLGCSMGITRPFHSSPLSKQVNWILCSLFCLQEKLFLQRRLSLSDTLGSAFILQLPSTPEAATFLTVSALQACAVRTQILLVRMKRVVMISFLSVT